jgi:hypothetical protein
LECQWFGDIATEICRWIREIAMHGSSLSTLWSTKVIKLICRESQVSGFEWQVFGLLTIQKHRTYPPKPILARQASRTPQTNRQRVLLPHFHLKYRSRAIFCVVVSVDHSSSVIRLSGILRKESPGLTLDRIENHQGNGTALNNTELID